MQSDILPVLPNFSPILNPHTSQNASNNSKDSLLNPDKVIASLAIRHQLTNKCVNDIIFFLKNIDKVDLSKLSINYNSILKNTFCFSPESTSYYYCECNSEVTDRNSICPVCLKKPNNFFYHLILNQKLFY